MALDEGADGGDVMPGLVLYGVFAKKRFQDRRSRFAKPGILVHVGDLLLQRLWHGNSISNIYIRLTLKLHMYHCF